MKTILIVTDQGDPTWGNALRENVRDLAILVMLPEQGADAAFLRESHDLVIIDAGGVGQASQLVRHLCALKPGVRIVVTTNVPTWREARAVLLAGAADYVPQSSGKGGFLSAIHQTLGLPTVGEAHPRQELR